MNKSGTRDQLAPAPRTTTIEFKSDDVIKIKFVKLWDLSGYSKRTTSKNPTCQMFRPKSTLEGFVQSHQCITGVISQRQLAPQCFSQVGPLDVVLSGNPDKSYNFPHLIFITSSFQNSMLLLIMAYPLKLHSERSTSFQSR